MGQKDIAEKTLEANNDVFSDIVNVLLFNGDSVLKEDELEDRTVRSAYKVDGKYREIERDVAKRWKREDIHVACIGLENQTKPDADMVLRILGYDGAEYRAQLNESNQSKRYPVVTLVLYFGIENRWDQPLTLLEALDVPERFKPYVNNYKVNLFEIAYLNNEQVAKFKSDFKVVADYFVQMRTTGTYVGSNEKLAHAQETLSLLSVMTGDHRFEEAMQPAEYEPAGKEINNMCEALDRIEEKGKMEAKKSMAISLFNQGVAVDVIAKAAEVTKEVVEKWITPKIA